MTTKPPTLDLLRLEYVDQGRRDGRYAPTTVVGMRKTLGLLTRAAPTEPEALKPRHVRAVMDRTPTPSTQHYRLVTMRNFCRWLVDLGHLAKDPTRDLVAAKQSPIRRARNLTGAEVNRLRLATANPREDLMLSLMVREAARCIEVAALMWDDIDRGGQEITWRGKGYRGEPSRTIPLTRQSMTLLDAWAESDWEPIVRSGLHVFQPHHSIRWRTSITAGHVSNSMHDLMVRAGVKQRPGDGRSAHSLRHTAAVAVAEHTRDPWAVQQLLGHRSVATSDVYLTGVRSTGLRSAMEEGGDEAA